MIQDTIFHPHGEVSDSVIEKTINGKPCIIKHNKDSIVNSVEVKVLEELAACGFNVPKIISHSTNEIILEKLFGRKADRYMQEYIWVPRKPMFRNIRQVLDIHDVLNSILTPNEERHLEVYRSELLRSFFPGVDDLTENQYSYRILRNYDFGADFFSAYKPFNDEISKLERQWIADSKPSNRIFEGDDILRCFDFNVLQKENPAMDYTLAIDCAFCRIDYGDTNDAAMFAYLERHRRKTGDNKAIEMLRKLQRYSDSTPYDVVLMPENDDNTEMWSMRGGSLNTVLDFDKVLGTVIGYEEARKQTKALFLCRLQKALSNLGCCLRYYENKDNIINNLDEYNAIKEDAKDYHRAALGAVNILWDYSLMPERACLELREVIDKIILPNEQLLLSCQISSALNWKDDDTKPHLYTLHSAFSRPGL
jgi:hypothetical protein